MQVRDFGNPHKPVRSYEGGASRWPLAARYQTTIEAGTAAQRIELDLAIKLEGGFLAAMVADRGLLALGLRAALPIEFYSEHDTLAPLSLLVDGGPNEVLIAPGTVLAQLVLLPVSSLRLLPDPDLDHEMHAPDTGLVFGAPPVVHPEPLTWVEQVTEDVPETKG